MTEIVYLAWRYLAFHRTKTAILVTSITLILYLPVGLRVLVDQSSAQLASRAEATPLIVGSRGSPLELVLNTLYYRAEYPDPLPYAAALRVEESALASAIPMYVRFRARGYPIVGTTLDYFSFRNLRMVAGRPLAVLGECVLGSRVAGALGLGPGDEILSSPESVFDFAGVYPLKMRVVGVFDFSDSADDDAIFVDVKTTWIMEGIGHGHQDLTAPEAVSGVLSRDGNRVVANASVVEYNEITPENIGTFHFHGDLSDYPLTAVIAVPPDQRSSTLLRGRYEATAAAETSQAVTPTVVMDELLATVLTVQRFVVAGAVIVGVATLASAALVFLLSLRLRRREVETLFKLGGSRSSVATIMASEMIVVLMTSVALAAGLLFLTGQFGGAAIRAIMRM